ncbi:catechol 2,3-dioxygenase-like lactoylglutathione lyase family enzyme [Kribbella orskensis]|uniref:Catechol 2,3-dioxygenase-like lactoylglutathione lyase family enzyme n=1 Tax=Kribbella orskensis TaxID=2512216 RepID=A0ABY2BQB0_9ACTN|nr:MULTISPECIES: VOC family protein [Kribbella]TCN42063.1 catechol 2,3-dioxygenase-like lactoylglutathione lyase family enzyme [Kribbella sp. VKM Ac-2500]TCO25941.1 catechol 2,3-dioxygenase-like lactoylglutathione lyase family enzyme [Kribbella orskensis]
MITNVSLVTVYVNDIDESKVFYTEKLGFVLKEDIKLPDFHWCTVYQADHPELRLALMKPGPPMDEESAESIRRIMAKGSMHGFGIRVDNCRKTFDELVAKGVEYIQEPSDRPYGVEAVLRDNSGNWLVLIEEKPYSPEDFA